MNDTSYNPFNDKKLHLTVDEQRIDPLHDREPFNDVIRHYDSIQGYQMPKRIDQYPRWFQSPRRIYATITALFFVSAIIYQVVQIFT